MQNLCLIGKKLGEKVDKEVTGSRKRKKRVTRRGRKKRKSNTRNRKQRTQ